MTQNGNGHSNLDGWRTQPMYTFSEAAQLAHVSTSTVRNWLRGYSGPERDIQPIFTTHDRNVAMVSFLNLIEIVVAGQFRKALGVIRPFAFPCSRPDYTLPPSCWTARPWERAAS